MKILNLIKILKNNLFLQSNIIIFIMIFGSLLEMISISLILPLLTLITDFEGADKYINYLNLIIKTENKSQTDLLFIICIIVGFIFVLKNIFLVLINYFQLNFIKKFHQLLGKKLVSIYLTRPLNYFFEKNSSTFIRNLSTDLTLLSYSILNYALIVMEGLVLFFIFSLLFFYNFQITIFLMLTFLTFTGFYLLITQKKIKQWGKIRHETESEKVKSLKEALVFIREIKLYNIKNHFLNLFNRSNKSFSDAMLKHNFVQSSARLFLEVLSVILILVLIIWLIKSDDKLDIIPLMGLYVGSAFKILPSVNRIINGLQQIKFVNPIIDNFSFDLLNKNESNNFDYNENLKFNKNISFKNLSFSHKKDNFIFKNLNLEIEKGSFFIILGDSGIGKSTFLDLLAGFQNPLEGKILIDNKFEIKDNIDGWQSNLGYTPQNNIILDTSILNNIVIGENEKLDKERLEEAISVSELKEVINQMPEGLHSILGENGNRISGGQKQRVGIARTIYQNKSVLLFDEATNALDTKTNSKVLNNLKKYGQEKNKTIIFITHNDQAEKYGDKSINLNKIVKS